MLESILDAKYLLFSGLFHVLKIGTTHPANQTLKK